MLKIRIADIYDSEDIWKWRNDPHTRKMFANTENISWERHNKWFNLVSNSKEHIILIAHNEEMKIGMIRFDINNTNSAEVSLNFNPDARGKGFGSMALNKSIEFIINKNINTITTRVRKENTIALKVWKKSNFNILTEDAEYFYLKLSV